MLKRYLVGLLVIPYCYSMQNEPMPAPEVFIYQMDYNSPGWQEYWNIDQKWSEQRNELFTRRYLASRKSAQISRWGDSPQELEQSRVYEMEYESATGELARVDADIAREREEWRNFYYPDWKNSQDRKKRISKTFGIWLTPLDKLAKDMQKNGEQDQQGDDAQARNKPKETITIAKGESVSSLQPYLSFCVGMGCLMALFYKITSSKKADKSIAS
jgi:hypothetical protein